MLNGSEGEYNIVQRICDTNQRNPMGLQSASLAGDGTNSVEESCPLGRLSPTSESSQSPRLLLLYSSFTGNRPEIRFDKANMACMRYVSGGFGSKIGPFTQVAATKASRLDHATDNDMQVKTNTRRQRALFIRKSNGFAIVERYIYPTDKPKYTAEFASSKAVKTFET